MSLPSANVNACVTRHAHRCINEQMMFLSPMNVPPAKPDASREAGEQLTDPDVDLGNDGTFGRLMVDTM